MALSVARTVDDQVIDDSSSCGDDNNKLALFGVTFGISIYTALLLIHPAVNGYVPHRTAMTIVLTLSYQHV